MTDYAASNTRRLKVTYTGPRGQHTMLFRNEGDAHTMAELIVSARTIAAAFNQFALNLTSWDSAEGAEQGSEIFLPVAWGAPIVQSAGTTPSNTTPFGAYIQATGRSTGGSKVAFYFLNINEALLTANNRLTPGEHGSVAGLLTALNSAASNLCAIDRQPFTLKGYLNTGINAHLARVSRRAA